VDVPDNNEVWWDVTYGEETFVAIGRLYDYDDPSPITGIARYSTDGGQTWTKVTVPQDPEGGFALDSVAYGAGKFVSCGMWLAYSADKGQSWTSVSYPSPDPGLSD
jgi:hypothetical protein